MSVQLKEYLEYFAESTPELRETLEARFHEAARIMSPSGLQDYLEGAKGLSSLGRGSNLVHAYLEQMPLVAREVGEDIVRDCISAAMKLSSMTSGEVIALLFNSLPTAARRLGDAELLRGYLQLIHHLSARAARGLRPMLGHIDELLSKLTLGGLRRWANFGAEAYRRDLKNLVAYFELATADSRAMLQKQRRGTLFIDIQRKLNFYMRAFWGRDFFLRPTEADTSGFRPYIESHIVHLPDAVDDQDGVTGLELYRAAAAHAAAHLMYTDSGLEAGSLSPAQMYFIGLVEDARVEYCAIREFPGLRRLWQSLLGLESKEQAEHPAVPTIRHMALMLLDSRQQCDDQALNRVAEHFHNNIEKNRRNSDYSRQLGLELYAVFAQRRDVPSLRILEKIPFHYRDDNRIVWHFDELSWAKGADYRPAHQTQVRRQVSVMEMVNELDCEFAGDDAQEVWRLPTAFWLDQEACTINELLGTEPISDPFHYPEWDYQVQLHRPDWVSVYERRQPKADPQLIDAILTEHRPIAARIRQIVDLLQPEGVQRVRNLEDGDEIDLNAAIDAMVAIRMGEQPSPRITMRNIVKQRDLAVMVLLDLSESTNDPVAGSDKTVLELTREACTLVATAINGIGDPFAVHGFASDSRHDVRYFRIKDFNERFNDEVKARLAGMRGGYSTRMGAAMRHAGEHLLKQPERKKLLLLVTDGEPADIDERDPQYLRHDTRKAVEELHRRGILSYCLTLDANADDYVKRIFGMGRYTIVDHVQRLPEKLPELFASLTS